MRNLSFVRILGRFRDLVGSNSTAMKALNPKPTSDASRTTDGSFANLKIIDKFNQELVSIRTYLETMHMKLRRATEQINNSEGKLQHVVNGIAKLKVKQTEDSKLSQGLDSEVSPMKTWWTQCDQLTESLQQQQHQTKQVAADEDKQPFEDMLANDSKSIDEFNYHLRDLSTKLYCAEQNVISDKLVKEKASLKIDLQMGIQHKKLRRVTELNLSEGKFQQVVNVNAKPQQVVNVNAKPQVKQGLDSEASLTKTLCDQSTETLEQLACEKEQDSDIKQLAGSISMLQHIEVTKNKLTRSDSTAEISASNISWVGKLPNQDCEQELLQKSFKLESDNQELLGQEKSKNAESLQGEIIFASGVLNKKEQLDNCSVEREKTLGDRKLQVEVSLAATECQFTEAKKQYDLILEGKKIELSERLREFSLQKDQAEKLTREMEKKCNEKLSEKKQDSERCLKEEHGTMVARIQQDKEHNESTLQAYLKEELQSIQYQAENELRERLSLFTKEHELQIKTLRMKHQEECQRLQEELELQSSKEKQIASMQLQKGIRENRQIDKEVNSKKVVVRSLCFPFHQFRMLSSNSIDRKAPGNTATIILDEYDLPASKRSYIKAMNKAVEWCKTNTKVFDLSEFFGPGAEVFTTPAEGIFHLKFKCRDRELTLFINGRTLYLMGWDGDRYGAFEIQEDDMEKSERCIQIPGCNVIKMGVNYCLISKHALGDVRIGLPAMIDAFEVLYRCDGISYNEALDAVTIFAVNTSEAIRDKEIFKEVQDSYDLFLDKLDSRWDKNSGKAPLSANIRTYAFYSREYLQYVDCMIERKPLPEINNRGEQNVKSIHELRNRIRVPLRDSYNEGQFHHEKTPKPPLWYPPYPDDNGWISEEEQE